MTDERFDISRRKALAALGTIGVASAGAGLGTSAYFSDQETFENNQLTAGTLDMKVAATEYYSDWSSDEADLAGMASDADSTDIRLPPGEDQSDAQAIALDLDDDYDGDGDVYGAFFETISSDADGNPYNEVNGGVAAASDGLCGTESDADGPVIIDIGDVKPGDFGGAQFAFELCDNPGYVWLTGGLRDANENGTTEPEADDPDEEDGVVELLDEIQVAYSVGPINDDPSGFADNGAGFEPVEQYTLREFLDRISNQPGTELSDGTMNAELGGGTGEQGCFAGSPENGSAVHQVSVVWWLPINHGNQVQSDSVTFDLGFYTEQCRHNDGTGMAPEATPLSIDSPQGQGGGFANAWDTSETLAHVGSGSWGTIDRSGQGSYKQGFYFAGDYDNIDALPSTYTVADIEEISYWLHEPTPLNGNDIYLLIYTRPEGDGSDGGGFYDSRLVALPSNANGSSPNFTPGEWNKFSTKSGASNTLVFDDSGHKPNNSVGGPGLPTLADLQSGPVDWTNYDSSLSDTYDYRNQEVLALSLQTNSTSPELEAYIDDVTVTLASGDTLRLDLEP
jgi:predicted ribosomally synthesized peptide with SipW-like signal peptide